MNQFGRTDSQRLNITTVLYHMSAVPTLDSCSFNITEGRVNDGA